MARGPERECADHTCHLEAHQGHSARVGVVGVRGPQTQELRLAGQPTAPVKFLDDDVVEVAGPVHGRAPVGLGDYQQFALGAERYQVAGRMRRMMPNAVPGIASRCGPLARCRRRARRNPESEMFVFM